MTQKNKYKRTVCPDTKIDDSKFSNDKIVDAVKIDSNNNKLHLTYLDENYIFKTPYARIGTFLASFGRTRISKMMSPYISSIYRCHTDGFSSVKKLDLSEINRENNKNCLILKYEGYIDDCSIHNVNKICNKHGQPYKFKGVYCKEFIKPHVKIYSY